MNNELIESLRKQLEKQLESNQHRYQHSIGVAHTSACLAMRYEYNMENAYIAGLLHDCAKCLDDQTMISESEKYKLHISEYERKGPYLLHGKLGAEYVKNFYHIDNPEILSSICSHTTGHANMSVLEMIVFIADYIEPMRNKVENLNEIRAMAFQSLEKTVYQITKDTLQYLNKKGATIDPATVETFHYYERFSHS